MDLGLQRHKRVEMGLDVFNEYCQTKQLSVKNK